MKITIPIVASVPNEWAADKAAGTNSTLEEVLLASHLLGANRALANFGGGNTSAKGLAIDHAGREIPAIWVKGSGSDLATMESRDFTPLRLNDILPLMEREEMSDEEMVEYLLRCQIDPSAPRSSIETLLHAFIPAAHVHHTHPDAINVMACSRDGQRLVTECFGDSAAWIDYIRPGFALAKQVGELVRTDRNLKLVVLAKHGLVVWGESAEEAYDRTVAVCDQAAEFVNGRTAGAHRFDGRKESVKTLDQTERLQILRSVLPTLRGAVGSTRSKLLVTDVSPAVCELVDSVAGQSVAAVGAACPDHLVHTKRIPMWVSYDPETDTLDELKDRIVGGAEKYRADYLDYFEHNASTDDVMSDPDPRIVLVEGLGLVAAGTTTRGARISRDLYHRAIEVMAGAHAISRFVSLTAAESFAIEYWPLELYKLSLSPAPRELQGKVAFVTGGAGGIGRAVLDALGSAGAAVISFDLDAEGAASAVAEFGEAGLAVCGDVTDEISVAGAFAAAIDTFGGIDVVVSNAGIASGAAITDTSLSEWNRNQAVLGTGYFLVAREAFRVMEAQARGGSIIFVASKNALAAGPNAAAYSSAKACELHLARCLAEEGGPAGIRVNTVNPDAVLQSSKIWDSKWRSARAAAYGIAPSELEGYYKRRTTLGVDVLPADVANAVMHFASATRSGKTTGNLLNVDGGVAAAYPR